VILRINSAEGGLLAYPQLKMLLQLLRRNQPDACSSASFPAPILQSPISPADCFQQSLIFSSPDTTGLALLDLLYSPVTVDEGLEIRVKDQPSI
jgi:hypothetical protein